MRKIWSSLKTLLTSSFRARAESRSWPNGFSMMVRTQGALPSLSSSGWAMLAEEVDDVGEVLRGRCQVEKAIAARLIFAVYLGQLLLQALVAAIVVEVHRVVLNAIDERSKLGVSFFHTTAGNDAFLHV